MSDILILITATIDPGSTPLVARNNPTQRRREYFESFRLWLESRCKADILLCENSGADLSEFRQLASDYRQDDSVRILSFFGNSGAEKFGRGYGEMEILKHVFSVVPELSRYRYILKVSGRYQYRKIPELVKGISESTAAVICDLHYCLEYADTTTAAFKPEIALKYLFPYQSEIDDQQCKFIEFVMARCVHRALLDGYSWSPLPSTPIAEGIPSNSNYLEKLLPWQHARIKWQRVQINMIRRVARWIYRH